MISFAGIEHTAKIRKETYLIRIIVTKYYFAKASLTKKFRFAFQS